MIQASILPANTHRVALGGETRECNIETYQTVCAELVAKHGGIPKIVEIGRADEKTVVHSDEPVDLPASAFHGMEAPEGINESGRARAAIDEEKALENGFAVSDPIYRLGTRVNEWGVANATASQLDHEKKPSAVEVCNQLVSTVRAENRQDLSPVNLSNMRMTSAGKIALPDSHTVHGGARLAITSRMFASLMGRFPCASGSSYLSDCPTKLRSINFNHWAVELGGIEQQSNTRVKEVVLRTRMMGGQRAAYAAVSPKYTAFDADKIGEALALAFPDDAKGTLDYDGERVRVEGLWHSDVEPAEYVAGEIFKAGVIVRSDDTGGGSIRVQSVIWRNLCQNLIILDKRIGVDIRMRHSGTVSGLARSFRKAFEQALTSVDAFRSAWTSARREEGDTLIKSVQGTTRDDITGLPVSAVLPGIFNSIMKRDLVPVRGRAEAVVPKLLEMHNQDEAAKEYGVSRASVVNAFTRYAHKVETNPYHADKIREGAGALLSGSKGAGPAPLGYLAFTG